MGNEQSKNPERIEPRQLSKFQFGSIIKPKSDIFNPPFEFPEHHVTQKDIIGVVVSHIKRDPVDVSKPPSELYEWSFGDTTNSDAMEVVVALLDMKKTYAEMEANTNPKFFIMREDQIGKVSVSENFRKNFFENPEKQNLYEVKDFSVVSYQQLQPISFNPVYGLQIPDNYNMDNLKGPPVAWANHPQLRTNDAWVYLKRFIAMKREETTDYTDVFAALNTEVENPEDNAATNIQSVYRGYNRRKKNSAASKIQSHWKKKKKMNKFLLSAKEKKRRKIDNLTNKTDVYFKKFEKKVTDSIDNIYRGNGEIDRLFSSFFNKIHKFYNYEKYLDEDYILPEEIYRAISMVLGKERIKSQQRENLKLIHNFFITEKNNYNIHKKLDNYLRIQKTKIKDPDSFKVGDVVLVTNINFSEKAQVMTASVHSVSEARASHRLVNLYFTPQFLHWPANTTLRDYDEDMRERLHKIEDETPDSETKVENITKMSEEEVEREREDMIAFQNNLHAQPADRHILAKWKKQTRTQANGETKENDRRVSEEEFDLRAEIKKKRLNIINDILNDSLFKNEVLFAPEGFITNLTLIQNINNNDEELATFRNWDERERNENENVGDIKGFLEEIFSLLMTPRGYGGEKKVEMWSRHIGDARRSSKVAEPAKLHILSFRNIITRIESGFSSEEFKERINDLKEKKNFFRCIIFYITKLIMNSEFYMSDWSKRAASNVCVDEEGNNISENNNELKEEIFWYQSSAPDFELKETYDYTNDTWVQTPINATPSRVFQQVTGIKQLTLELQENQKNEWEKCGGSGATKVSTPQQLHQQWKQQLHYAMSVTSDIEKAHNDIQWLFGRLKINLWEWTVDRNASFENLYRRRLKKIIGKTWCALNKSSPLLSYNYGHQYCSQAFDELWQLEENTNMTNDRGGMHLSLTNPFSPFYRTSIDYISDAVIYNKSNHYLMSLIERVECIRYISSRLFTELELEKDDDLTSLILLSKKMIIYNYNVNDIAENKKQAELFNEFYVFVARQNEEDERLKILEDDLFKLSEELAFKIDDDDIYAAPMSYIEKKKKNQKIFEQFGVVKRKKVAYDYIKELVEEKMFSNPKWNIPIEWETFDEALENLDPRFFQYSRQNFIIDKIHAGDNDLLDLALNNDSQENLPPYYVGPSNVPTHAGGKRKSKIIKKSRKKKKNTKKKNTKKKNTKKKNTKKKRVKKSE